MDQDCGLRKLGCGLGRLCCVLSGSLAVSCRAVAPTISVWIRPTMEYSTFYTASMSPPKLCIISSIPPFFPCNPKLGRQKVAWPAAGRHPGSCSRWENCLFVYLSIGLFLYLSTSLIACFFCLADPGETRGRLYKHLYHLQTQCSQGCSTNTFAIHSVSWSSFSSLVQFIFITALSNYKSCPGILFHSKSCPGYNRLIPFQILSWFCILEDKVVELVGGGSEINALQRGCPI